MRYFTGPSLCCATLALLCLTLGCEKKKEAGQLPDIKFTALAKQAPVPLQVATVDKFVDWVSTMPSTQVDDVKQQIALVKSDPKIVDAVAAKLSFINLGSYGRQLIYLSILGEMKNDRALPPLENYLYSSDCPVFEERAAFRQPSQAPNDANQGTKTSIFDSCAGLKAHAVNMVAYLNSAAAQATVLKAVNSHPSRTVRLSAMNAYLYNHGDSPEAIATVSRLAKPQEAKFVGLPRLAPGIDPKEFASRMARFYSEHGDELPPMPQKQVGNKISRGARPQKQSVNPSMGNAKGGAQ